ncbi:MAG: nucleotide exchange factor GrpE [Thermoplasmata archaeon]|nr:nucleotide exchange factor GrpE [Thermoplasmata archaeon]
MFPPEKEKEEDALAPNDERTEGEAEKSPGEASPEIEEEVEDTGGEEPGGEGERTPEDRGADERYLRLLADFDNYKKRMAREREEWTRTSLEPVFIDLLEVVDDMERALAAGEHSPEDWRRGVEMIYRKMLSIMERHGVRPFDSVGEVFDHRYHEALARAPADGEGDDKGA